MLDAKPTPGPPGAPGNSPSRWVTVLREPDCQCVADETPLHARSGQQQAGGPYGPASAVWTSKWALLSGPRSAIYGQFTPIRSVIDGPAPESSRTVIPDGRSCSQRSFACAVTSETTVLAVVNSAW